MTMPLLSASPTTSFISVRSVALAMRIIRLLRRSLSSSSSFFSCSSASANRSDSSMSMRLGVLLISWLSMPSALTQMWRLDLRLRPPALEAVEGGRLSLSSSTAAKVTADLRDVGTLLTSSFGASFAGCAGCAAASTEPALSSFVRSSTSALPHLQDACIWACPPLPLGRKSALLPPSSHLGSPLAGFTRILNSTFSRLVSSVTASDVQSGRSSPAVHGRALSGSHAPISGAEPQMQTVSPSLALPHCT
mmetsp:Transcript_98447/g.212324  ORF Transcript_98447/g.212324 Transcript_98447/m.212324 type:complete len:249 (-) Transcript_98447:90-836(-)